MTKRKLSPAEVEKLRESNKTKTRKLILDREYGLNEKSKREDYEKVIDDLAKQNIGWFYNSVESSNEIASLQDQLKLKDLKIKEIKATRKLSLEERINLLEENMEKNNGYN